MKRYLVSILDFVEAVVNTLFGFLEFVVNEVKKMDDGLGLLAEIVFFVFVLPIYVVVKLLVRFARFLLSL